MTEGTKDTMLAISGIFAMLAFFFFIVVCAIEDDKQHVSTCGVCGSTNISSPYEDKRGLLSHQDVFYCYDCDKEYNINLRNRTYVSDKGDN